ncbi:MAG: septal ring lytic transglycosylase RlpA family protein [Betaproteobacteria bacterium]
MPNAPTPRRCRLQSLAVLSLVLWLTACASSRSPTSRLTAPPDLAADGPPLTVPPGLAEVPNAVPRVEPLRVGGPNKPYEVAGRLYVPIASDLPLVDTGGASWYGRKYHGRPTSSGEPYDMFGMTGAHTTMPIPSYARVTNPANGREVIVRINDRGPFVPGRVIDLSYTAALKLDTLRSVTPVIVERLTHDAIRALRWLSHAPDTPEGGAETAAALADGTRRP